jgi:hypothetical protein
MMAGRSNYPGETDRDDRSGLPSTSQQGRWMGSLGLTLLIVGIAACAAIIGIIIWLIASAISEGTA